MACWHGLVLVLVLVLACVLDCELLFISSEGLYRSR
jgi:hypothetical protein